ncbi:hypothetical protein LshimejAT787_0506890 [Lyophyllum shimeji]|uniref:Uncharacterized protein n=1 Tax=Lyophyllum shimeji TaxID=47721 RepID=A0A9P3PNS1_LYOSH|nr:hypothetical protein LshimejAT787_0506890 [Lyophyllum shimeji]
MRGSVTETVPSPPGVHIPLRSPRPAPSTTVQERFILFIRSPHFHPTSHMQRDEVAVICIMRAPESFPPAYVHGVDVANVSVHESPAM